MKSVKCCPVCGDEQIKELWRTTVGYQGADWQSNLLDIDYIRNYILFDRILNNREPIKVTFWICADCGLIFFTPRPEGRDMEIKYKLTAEMGYVEAIEENRYKKTHDDKRAREIFKLINRFRQVQGANVIDLGGGHGLNLRYFLKGNNCFVVDYVRQELMEGVKYLCRTTEEISEAMKCGLVLYCHTLEHVVDPVGEILRIKDILEAGGVLYIEVPFEWQQGYRSTKNLLTHINFFSSGSLYYLLHQCGLRIRYIGIRPILNRTMYDYAVVAIAEKSSPGDIEKILDTPKVVKGYDITREEMAGKHIGLRIRWAWLNFRLMKFDFIKMVGSDIWRRIRG